MELRRKADRIWQNLLDNKCPKCGNHLIDGGSILHCSGSCDFSITSDRAFELKNKMSPKSPADLVGKKKILDNGKVVFKNAKIFRGERPAQPLNLGF